MVLQNFFLNVKHWKGTSRLTHESWKMLLIKLLISLKKDGVCFFKKGLMKMTERWDEYLSVPFLESETSI